MCRPLLMRSRGSLERPLENSQWLLVGPALAAAGVKREYGAEAGLQSTVPWGQGPGLAPLGSARLILPQA